MNKLEDKSVLVMNRPGDMGFETASQFLNEGVREGTELGNDEPVILANTGDVPGVNTAKPGSAIRSHQHNDNVRLPAYSVHMDAIRALAAFLVLAGHARMLLFGNHQGHGANGTGPVKSLG